MNKPLLIQSLPNSGSSWFAECVQQGTGYRYQMEYFNPIRNPQHSRLLQQEFGCELISCFHNIATGPGELFDRIVQDTFLATDLQMTKEVFSPFKTAGFQRYFDVVIFFAPTVRLFSSKTIASDQLV